MRTRRGSGQSFRAWFQRSWIPRVMLLSELVDHGNQAWENGRVTKSNCRQGTLEMSGFPTSSKTYYSTTRYTVSQKCTSPQEAIMNPSHLAIVNTNDTADHFWNDDHVTKVSLNHGRLLIGRCLFLSFAEFLDETHGTTLETALEPAASTGMNELGAKEFQWNTVKLMYRGHTSTNCKL